MIDRKEIEMLIRAQVKGGRGVKEITKEIEGLGDAIATQAAQAKRGERSIKDLEATYESLKRVQEELGAQANLVGAFQRQQAAIDKTNERIKRAGAAYTEYRDKVLATGVATERQLDRVDALNVKFERQQSILVKQQQNLESYRHALQEAGVEISDLANVEAKLREAAASTGLALAKASTEMREFGTEARKAAAETAAGVKAADDRRAAMERLLNTVQRANAAQAGQKQSQINANEAAATQALNARREATERLIATVQRLAAKKVEQETADNTADLAKRQSGTERLIATVQRLKYVEDETNKTLREQAQVSEAAARGYTTLARASTDLRPKVVSVRDALSEILNPTAQAQKSLKGLEDQVQATAKAVGTINGPIKDYKQRIAEIEGAQRALAAQGNLIDTFRKQTQAVREARTEFAQARADVTQYAAALRQGGAGAAEFQGKLSQAEAKMAAAANALRRQVIEARATRDALREAGVSTTALSNAETRLTEIARQSAASMNQLTAAYERHGVEKKKAAGIGGLFNDSGRTTLSLVQRLRGEVLALAAAYVGLQGGISLGGGALKNFNTREAAKNQLSISVGSDKAAIDEEYNYVRAQADRIGIEFERAIKGYAKFSAAATLAGRSRQEIRYIYETFSELGRVANLSADDLDGVFKALEQITSKGKIQAEELRGQLGDRLFGAFEVAAKSLKSIYPDLDKAMKDGLVTSNQLIRIAEQYKKIVANELPAAQQSLAAEQMRLNNAVFDFKLAIADSGFADAYKEMLPVLTDFLQSDDGAKFAKSIGAGFTALAKGIVYLVTNLDTVMNVLKVVAGYWVVMTAASQVVGLVAAAGALKLIGSNLVTAAVGVKAFALAWPMATTAVLAFIAGAAIGTWAYREFGLVRKYGAALVTGLDELWTRIKYGAQILWLEVPRYAKNAFARLLNTATEGMRRLLLLFAGAAAAMGNTGLAASIGEVVAKMTFSYEEQGSEVERIKARMEADIKAIRSIRQDMFDEADRSSKGYSLNSNAGAGRGVVNPKRVPGTFGDPTARPPLPDGKDGGVDEKAANKRLAKIEEITRALEALEAKIDRSQTDTLASQLAAVDVQYAALERKIDKLGGIEEKRLGAQALKLRNQLKLQITQKFGDDLLKQQNTLLNKVESVEAAAGKKDKLSLQSRLDGIAVAYEDSYRDINELRLKLFNNDMDTGPADEAKRRLDAGIRELQNLERIKYAKEELERREQAMNDQLELRNKQLAVIKEQEEAGIISRDVAAQETNRINMEAIVGINAAAEATRQWAIANAAVFNNPEQQAAFIAMLDAVIAKAGAAKKEFGTLGGTVISGGLNGINSGLNSVFENLTAIITKQKSAAQGFKDLGRATLGIFAQFFQDIALAILKLAIFNMMKQSGNPYVAAIGAAGAASVGVKHAGGVMGSGPSNRSRNLGSMVSSMPRYHEGGVPGLKDNEMLAVLEKNEEVLAKESPRNILNGGAAAGGAMPQGEGGTSRIVLVDDQRSALAAMASADGGRVFVQHVKKNVSTLKSLLGI